MRNLLWLSLLLAVLFAWSACGDDDDDDNDDGGLPDICDDLGDLPVEGGMMEGEFTFSSGEGFPLSLTLAADSQTLSGNLTFDDSSQTYNGVCTGDWDNDGDLTAECVLQGTDGTVVTVDIDGEIGNDGTCGSWENDAGQSGDYWAERTI
ncbi:MAG TPA: hypothetical protein PKW95_09935 [bacterium]|nr:hypothetical protein [bacterium]